MEGVDEVKRVDPKDSATLDTIAELMATQDPWKTLKVSLEKTKKLVGDPNKQVFVVRDEHTGVIESGMVLDLNGPFKYIHILVVRPGCQGKGLGKKMLSKAEALIGEVSSDAFICVSSFNERAKKLYESQGYQVVGVLKDYIERGLDELLLRKNLHGETRNEFSKRKFGLQ